MEDLKKMKRIVNLINFIPLVFLLFFLFSVLFFKNTVLLILVWAFVGLTLLVPMLFCFSGLERYIKDYMLTAMAEKGINEHIESLEKASRFSDKELNGWLNENIKYKDLYDFSSFYTLSYDALRVEIENRLKIYKDKTFKYPPKNSVYNFFEKLFTKLHLI